jgi:hypothetical protein
MQRLLIAAALLASLPALASERVSATRVAQDVYKLDDGRVVITTGCSVTGSAEDAILNDAEDMLTFIDDEEECDVRTIHRR